MNSCQKVKQLTSSIIWELWDVCVKQFTKKRPDLWESRNARSNNAIVIRHFLTKNGTNTIRQSPNSTDLLPCDFFLSSRLKKSLRETRFSSQEEIMKKSKTALMAKPKTEYKNCLEDWIKRWLAWVRCSRRGVLWRRPCRFWWINLYFSFFE